MNCITFVWTFTNIHISVMFKDDAHQTLLFSYLKSACYIVSYGLRAVKA